MKILSIETSCDETAVSIVHARGTIEKPSFTVLGNALYSQVAIHAQYGGVFPMLAKREHAKNILPLLEQALREAVLLKIASKKSKPQFNEKKIGTILLREPELLDALRTFGAAYKKPNIDAIAVTFGPGLEPALWVGITVAKALGVLWDIPVIPVNHMEGHIVSVLFSNKQEKSKQKSIRFPSLSLLISGGHTELVVSKNPLHYKVIGKTRDDALGEAFDKVARMMDLSYPGGPEVSKLAAIGRKKKDSPVWNLPRPMLHTKDFDFSFSGLKTSVLYKTREHGTLSKQDKITLSREFEDAVTEVIITKTRRAIEQYKPKSLVIGGGVIANTFIRSAFEKLCSEYDSLELCIPEKDLATDNSVMIGMAGYLRIQKSPALLRSKKNIVAKGNVAL